MPDNYTAPMKISAWLGALDSHDIYTAAPLGEDFIRKTGLQPCWPVHTYEDTQAAIERRGLGGFQNSNKRDNAWGWEIALALAQKYANYSSHKLGRGFIFRDCLEALVRAGK